MKKILLLFAICTILFSCKQGFISNDLNKNLFTFFKENFKSIDSTIHVDSVRVVKLDTVTKQKLVYEKIKSLYDEMDRNQKLIHDISEVQRSNMQIITLSSGLDKSITDNYIYEMKQKMKEMRDLMVADSLLQITADSLTKIHEFADTTKLLYHEIRCLVQYQRKDMTIKRDTFSAFLSPEKNIIKRDEMRY